MANGVPAPSARVRETPRIRCGPGVGSREPMPMLRAGLGYRPAGMVELAVTQASFTHEGLGVEPFGRTPSHWKPTLESASRAIGSGIEPFQRPMTWPSIVNVMWSLAFATPKTCHLVARSLGGVREAT